MTVLTQPHVSCRPAPQPRISFFGLMSLYRQRRALAVLSDAQIKDIGLTRTQAITESRRAFWDIPVQHRIYR